MKSAVKESSLEQVATTAASLALEKSERKRRKEDKAKRSRKRAARDNSRNAQSWASDRSLGFEDEDLGSSPGWWPATVATYCPSRPGELPKFKVATYRHMYRHEPKEPCHFVSLSGSEIDTLSICFVSNTIQYQGGPAGFSL